MVSSAALIMLNRRRGRWQTLKLEIRSVRSDELGFGADSRAEEQAGVISKGNVVLDGQTRTFPELCANQKDYERGTEQGIAAKATMFNCHYTIENARISEKCIEEMRTTFKKIVQEYKPPVTSMSFTPYDRVTLTYDDRLALLELQRELDTTFIADTESHGNQTHDRFLKELDEFARFDTDQIKSPTISIRCGGDRFRQKATTLIADSEYLRFNVHWGGYERFKTNWIFLAKEMNNRAKWCNMIGILPRKITTTKRNPNITISNMSHGLTHGVHTFCFGIGGREGSKAQSSVLNGESWCYEKTDDDYDKSTAISFNVISDELETLRQIINTPDFHEHWKPRVGLHIVKDIDQVYRSTGHNKLKQRSANA